MFDVHDKQTGVGPYPSMTLSNACNPSNGCGVAEPESHDGIEAGSEKMSDDVTVVNAVRDVAGPHESPKLQVKVQPSIGVSVKKSLNGIGNPEPPSIYG